MLTLTVVWLALPLFLGLVSYLLPKVARVMVMELRLNTINLFTTKPLIILKPNWSKPKLCFILIAFNMDVGWFITVSGVAKETIWTNCQKGRHSVDVELYL